MPVAISFPPPPPFLRICHPEQGEAAPKDLRTEKLRCKTILRRFFDSGYASAQNDRYGG